MASRTRTMNVSLTPALAKYVESLLKEGTFGSASEVVRDALRNHQENREAQYRWIRQEIAAGMRELDRGEGVPAEKAFAELRGRFRRLRKSA